MKLSDWAKKNGLTYQTAFNLFKKKQLPGHIRQLESGTILVDDEPFLDETNLQTYIYCRVSSSNKKDDLDRQVERCLAFCQANGWTVDKVVKEVASGMNDSRNKLLKILDKHPKRIVVEHKDRLTRFGFNYFDTLLPLLHYKLVVINKDTECEQDLMKDLVAIITSFCCRLYGLRRGRNKTVKIKQVLQAQE